MISIIVPVYNIENYLSRCLDSILCQSYSDFELILVDDGSTDSSGIICDQYATKDKRIIVIHQENMGSAPARNTGLKRCKGEYILMIDGDDFIHSRMVEILYGLITSGDYDFAMCSYKPVNESDKVDLNKQIDIVSTTRELSQDDCMRTLYLTKDTIEYAVLWNKLYTRKLLEGLSFDYDASQDDEFNNKVYLRMQKAIYTTEQLHFYVHRPGSLQHRKIRRRYFDTILTFEACLDEIPTEQKSYRGYCLYTLYKRMLWGGYYAKGTQYEDYVRGISSRIRAKTINELLQSSLPLKDKLALAFLTKYKRWYYMITDWRVNRSLRRKH